MKFLQKQLPREDWSDGRAMQLWNQMKQALRENFSMLESILNQGIDIDNTAWVRKTITAPAIPHLEFSVSVSMKHAPSHLGYMAENVPAVLYKGPTPWTKDEIYLKSTVGSATFTIEVK